MVLSFQYFSISSKSLSNMSVPVAWICVIAVASSFVHVANSDDKVKSGETFSHIFDDPTFWNRFQAAVLSHSWNCNFDRDVFTTTLQKDTPLYSDPTLFLKRRLVAQQWVLDPDSWSALVLGACKELAHKLPGNNTRAIQNLGMLEPFQDYVDHLDYFHKVQVVMAKGGYDVVPISQDSTRIHDIDKLDPVMMVGYSERFEDGVSTSVWDLCVDRHTRVNPHHQAHCVWHDCCGDKCPMCRDVRDKALKEMVCDKVSRRLQKNLGGVVSKEMWDVEMAYYVGLPQDWLDRAAEMMRDLKESMAL